MSDSNGGAPSLAAGQGNELLNLLAKAGAASSGSPTEFLMNLALANQVANTNLAAQNALANQQAMYQVQLSIIAKCVELISQINPNNPNAADQLRLYSQVMSGLSGAGLGGGASGAGTPSP